MDIDFNALIREENKAKFGLTSNEALASSEAELEQIFEIMTLARSAAHRLAEGSVPYKEIVWMRVLDRLNSSG
jgi:hypothetical protein